MLKLENLTIRFGGLVAVNDLSLKIEKGEIFGLIGPNGAGKTTVFNLISGVFKPTSGAIYLNDKRIDGLEPYQTNEIGISRTYQNIILFKHMTVLENVLVGRHSRLKSGLFSAILRSSGQRKEEAALKKKCEEMLAFVGLSDKKDWLAKHLPYGEQRLLEIARAMSSEPELLLLDEPAAGMNMQEKNHLQSMLQRIKDIGMTILLVEHDMKVVMGITDRICVLNYGNKIAEGPPEFIQDHPKVIEAYLGSE